MIQITRTITCDICKKTANYSEERKDEPAYKKVFYDENGRNIGWISQGIPVRFVTEQTEGMETEPYLGSAHIDMCPECYRRYLDAFPLSAAGAQGYNEFFWKDEDIPLQR